ncbi:vWA domain-containing protein [Novipirellula artificiosorum]|uniref:von Willebrand factor type A domain protein n=1 Tax=Novipirellula artificiosorum TaxID=2528016 RepID=A0A5C6DN67_9BACT|nr:VWA domain-containing protein [Novipirellula artificiosorum]TWU38218.1 von Willebrand factor type A domain protein [Novipirellula artificiosorum]
MNFAYPWLLLLTSVPIALTLRWRQQPRSLSVPSLRQWDDNGQGRARYLWVPPTLRVVGLTLLILALARPQADSTHSTHVSEGIAIELLVDVSSSMSMDMKLAEGESHSRIDVAKKLVERFIAGDGRHLHGRDGDLLGLITFARYADTRSPLTLGHDALLELVRNLEIQERPNEDGTGYGDALAIAAARLKQLDDPEIRQMQSLEGEITSRVIILLTDGENNSGQHMPVEAAGLAKEWGCRVYCISLGDRPREFSGQVIESTQLTEAERVLKHISLETGGVFRTAFDFDSLLAVYAEIDQLERSRVATRGFTQIAEWFWLPLAAAIFVFFSALLVEATWLRAVP